MIGVQNGAGLTGHADFGPLPGGLVLMTNHP